jgi:hypothetical protein
LAREGRLNAKRKRDDGRKDEAEMQHGNEGDCSDFTVEDWAKLGVEAKIVQGHVCFSEKGMRQLQALINEGTLKAKPGAAGMIDDIIKKGKQAVKGVKA